MRAMHCRACGAELILTNVIPDDTMVRGFEHHSFICSACHVTEHRVLFMRHGEDSTQLLPVSTPSRPNVQEEHLFGRVIALIRGH